MSAPTSKVDICNMAMDHLSQAADITNIDNPETEEEKKCARWYDAVRRSTLRGFPFTFARARFQCSRDSVAPTFGYADAYNLPTDLVRLNFIGNDDISNYKYAYAMEGRKLLLNNSGAASINIGYTKDETTVTKFDALFVDLIAIELAFRLAYAFTQKPSVKKLLSETREALRTEAKAVNSQERPPKRIENSKFRNARKRITSNVAGKVTVFDW